MQERVQGVSHGGSLPSGQGNAVTETLTTRDPAAPGQPGHASNGTELPSFDQQTSFARFGEFALKADDLDAILHEACRLVGEAFQTPLAKVMESQGDGQTMLVRAGVGWKPGIVGKVKVEVTERTAEQYTLQTGEPAVSPDIKTEHRFDYPDFIKDHGVRALATVIIVGADGAPPYGVLQVDSPAPRAFSDGDTQFLRGYANLLAAAIERHRMLTELKGRAEEKERLLQELQHRVTNNLQTVMGLVRRAVRGARQPETVEALQAVGNGIEALRMIHNRIYRMGEGADRTCLGTYLAELAASLLAFHGKDVVSKTRLVSDVERVEVASDIAIPFGLILSEFITNSLKYAFGNGEGQIGLRVEDDKAGLVRVTLWDDGKGLPDERAGGTGIRLIDGLARQAGGAAQWIGGQGTRLVVSLPIPAARACG